MIFFVRGLVFRSVIQFFSNGIHLPVVRSNIYNPVICILGEAKSGKYSFFCLGIINFNFIHFYIFIFLRPWFFLRPLLNSRLANGRGSKGSLNNFFVVLETFSQNLFNISNSISPEFWQVV